MWYLSQIQLIALLSYTSLALYVLARNPGRQLNRSLAALILCLALWSLEQWLYTAPATTAEHLRAWDTIGGIGWIGMSPAFLWFVQTLTGRVHSCGHRWFLGLAAAGGAVLFIAHCRQLLVVEFVRMPYGWTSSWSRNAWMAAYLIYYNGLIASGLLILVNYIRQPSRNPFKRHALLLCIFTLIGLGLASLTDIAAPLFGMYEVPPIGNVLCLVWALGLGYSIARHRFLTITPATAAENIITTMSDLLILTDIQGRIIRVNRAVEACLQWDRKTLEGRHISEIFMAPHKGASGTQIGGDSSCVENQRLDLKTRSGHGVPAILSSSQLMDNDQPAGNVVLIKDISRLHDAEQALKVSEARYRDLVETINEVVFSLDSQGKITYVSPSFESLTGYKVEDAIGKRNHEFIHPDDFDRLQRQQAGLFKGQVNMSRYRLLRKDGDLCWVQASSRPVIVNGQVVGANGILTDITHQVMAQKEKEALITKLARAEKMEAIGTLAGAVAHDLNNVLSGIVTYPELMLLKLPAGSKLRDMAQTIKASGQKAAAIVEDLLTLARRGVVTTALVNMNQVIRDYLASPEHLKLTSLYPNIRIEMDLAKNLDNILGSPLHLTKTIMNLISNAFEAIPENGGQITLKTENGVLKHPSKDTSAKGSTRCIVLRIRDTGQGIAPEDQERIFEPFFTRKVMGRSGTGLGMAVVWGAVQDHVGHIELKSQLGLGTEFTLYFPTVQGKILPAKNPEGIEAYLGRGETILLVDDVLNQRKIATDLLTRMGYTVHAVASGESAIDFLYERSVDLVILDMVMDPGMDGLDTFRRISKIRPNQKVIIASGYSKSERIQIALDSGVLACLKKPYLLEEIGSSVRAALTCRLSTN